MEQVKDKVQEMEVFVHENVVLGENEAWVFVKDNSEEGFLEPTWKVYINIFVTDIIKVAFDRDKHEDGLLCIVNAYMLNDEVYPA